MARTAVLLVSVLLVIRHLKASESAYREGDDSVDSDGLLSSQEMPTDGKSNPNVTLVELLLPAPPQNSAPEINKRIGDLEEVTHGVGYETHLDPHYYQRRDMGRYYDCARQGPWKPIHGHSAHRQPHGAADESGSHPQRPVHLQTRPHKQNNNGYENHLDEWDQQPKEIIHGQQPPPLVGSLVIGSSVPPMIGPPVVGTPVAGPPLVGGGYRKLPHWRGKGGGGRGIHQGGVIQHIRPSGGGQPTQQVIYHANGHQGAPLYHVHVRKPAPSIFGDDEWHHWFYSEEHGPYEHEGEESNQDHKDLSSFHEAEEHVGGGGYSEGDSQEVPEESSEEEEEDSGPYRDHHSGEQGDAEGQRDEQYEDEGGSQEQSTNVSGESGGGQADENKLPCEEEEEEAPAPTANEGSAPPEEDLSFLEIMYPPPLPQPAQVITAPALEEPHPHSEEAGHPPVHHSHVLVPVQQAYDTIGYNSSPPKCPYADHTGDPNHVHAHLSPSQEMLPPKQESRDTRGAMPLLPPMQQYEVYEDGAEEGVILRQPHAQQTSHFEGDVTPELVFGQRIPPKKTVLKVYGKPMSPGPGFPALQNSLGEAANYPEEQKDGNAVLRPPPLLLRDSYPNIKGMKVLMDVRRKRPSMWPSGKQPVKMQTQMLLRPRRIPRRPTARMTVTLP